MRRLIFLFILSSVFLFSCESVRIIDENNGVIKFSLKGSDETKAVTRDIPDSNSFILSVKNSAGTSFYNGKYGEKPNEFSIPAGTYDIEINSTLFTVPEFETPLYRDSKTVIVESGKISSLSLVCKQVNSGLRLKFTQNFLDRFSNFKPELCDLIGKKLYPFTENRFLYFNPGSVKLYLLNNSILSDTVKLISRTIAPNTMLTLNLDVLTDGDSGVLPGITVDTTSTWEYSDFIYGSEKEGNGTSPENAFLISQVSKNIGATGVWVTGYIVGGDLTSSNISFTAPFTSETNIALANSPSVSTRADCVSVALPTGAIRSALSLVANPSNLGQKVYIKGNIVATYFGLNGLNPITEYKLE